MPLKLLLENAPPDAGHTDVSVRLDGSERELAEVEFVTYFLQSFGGNPLRRVRERANGFRLDTVARHLLGVQARVHRRDGSELLLES
jgi:hypothetical protein